MDMYICVYVCRQAYRVMYMYICMYEGRNLLLVGHNCESAC